MDCTGVVVVGVGHPEGHREQLEDEEGVEHLLHQQNMVWLHRHIDGVHSITGSSSIYVHVYTVNL